MLNALVTDANEIIEYRNHAIAPPDLPQKALRWLPVQDTNPPYDGDAQNRTGPVISVLSDQVTRVWTVVDKTAGEIDADKTARANSEIDGMKALKALVVWLAPLVGKTPTAARKEIIAVYKSLP